MKNIIFILTIGWLMPVSELSGQCISRDSLWNRLMVLWHSPPISPPDQLKELMRYESVIGNCNYRDDSVHALLLFRIGATFNRQANFDEAVRYTRLSINMVLANANKSSINPRHVIKYYYFLSVFYDSLSQVAEQMKALEDCIAASRKLLAEDLFCCAALRIRAEYFYDVGDYHRCLSYAENGEKVSMEYAKIAASTDSIKAIETAAVCFQWQINVLIQLKNNEVAKSRLIAKIDECKTRGDELYLATLYHQLAQVSFNQGDYTKAEFYYNQALYYAKKLRLDINAKIIWYDLGYNIYFKRYQQWDRALFAYRKALAFTGKDKSRRKEDAIESLNLMGNIANVYVKKGLFDSALHYFQLALDQVRPGMTEKELLRSSLDDIVKTKRIYYLTGLLIDKGDAYKEQFVRSGEIHFLKEAIEIYKSTDRILDRIRTEQATLQSKLFWREDTRRLYEHAIESCYIIQNINDAFHFFERSRAVLLNDQLNEHRLLERDDIRKLTQLKKNILQKERELKGVNVSSEDYRKFQRELFTTQQDMDRLTDIIRATNPIYYESFLDTGFITISQIRTQILQHHQALVEIFSGDSAIYCFAITSQRTWLTKIKKNGFDSLANLYISHISKPNLLNKNFNGFINLSKTLYELIFDGITLPRGRIIISPDGHYFPFEALVVHAEPLEYFLHDHAVSYTYSARYLMNEFVSSSRKTRHQFLGLAPVRYPSDMNLPSLPGSDKSLNKIGSYFHGGEKLIASEASRRNFMQKFYQYRVIQLYTHASDTSINGEPVIFFADSALYLSDLISEKSPVTSLVVLSACETGTGKIYQGEGVFSFNRGFAGLGIPACIANLWSVDNEATYKLNEIFYRYLAEGLPTDIALQKAKLEFIDSSPKEKKLPVYWAAAVLAGRTDVIDMRESWAWENRFVLIGFLILVVIIIWWTYAGGKLSRGKQQTKKSLFKILNV